MNIRRSIRALMVAATVGLAVVGPAAGAAYGDTAPKTTDCLAHLADAATGSIELTASPAAGDVSPGADITISTRWDDRDWDELNKVLACVTSDGTYSPALSGGEKPADNDGEFVWHLAVPADAKPGTQLCVRDVIFGNPLTGSAVQASNALCFRVAAVVAPMVETTTTTAPAPEPEIQVIAASPAASPAPTVAVAPQVEEAPVPLAELPRTGSPTAPLLVAAGACLLSGGLALFAGRRRQTAPRV